jgi:hypothetical protein
VTAAPDTEATIMRQIQLAASRLGNRLWRNNVGVGWVGWSRRITAQGQYTLMPGDVVVRAARPLHAGLAVGSGDLIGYTMIDDLPVFTSIECKSATGSSSEAQIAWHKFISAEGAISGECRSPAEYQTLVT